jgi:hypothetical protein
VLGHRRRENLEKTSAGVLVGIMQTSVIIRDKKHMAGLVTKNTTTTKLTSLGEVELTAAKIS